MSWRKASEPAIAASATAAIETILAGRKRDIGGFSVERLLPLEHARADRAGEARLEGRILRASAGRDRIHPAAGSVK